MNATIIPQLIRKDIDLYRNFVIGGLAAGVVSILLILFGRGVLGLIGIISLFITMIVFASLVTGQCLVNERKHQTLSFLMSLPLSALQYTVAKLASAFVLFLVPWLVLTAAGTWIVMVSPAIAHGVLPMFLSLCLMIMVGMFLTCGVALVAESEGWFVTATVVVNVSYNFVWIAIVNTPSLLKDLKGSTPVWNSTMLGLIGGELALMAAVIGFTLWLQSRKRDFI
ncbi:MAG TPA: hypothetical protein VMJ34_05400 [Bryobacteraceae bacterium]|nr:hypothetical protein [Bryobacteraceae bacterium]